MYDVALSVLACVRANTAVHVAWQVDGGAAISTDALALTPGGGRIGSLLGGALDDAILERVPSVGASGRLVRVPIGPLEALTTDLDEGDIVHIALAPGDAIPEDIWEHLAERRPVTFTIEVGEDGSFGSVVVADGETPASADSSTLVCDLSPTPRALIVGGGPIGESLVAAFDLIGWAPMPVAGPGEASGIAPTLAPIDAVVVMGHDVEMSGRSLQAAVGSRAGYIASLGSLAMQEHRRDWLAYRGVDWDPRIHGPAGLPIGARDPGEIAISIVAEAIAAARIEEPSNP